MNLLKTGHAFKTGSSRADGVVSQFLGGGGQGEVYRAKVGGQDMALKWYFPQQATPEQRQALEKLIKSGPPTDRFLWPLEMTVADGVKGFGYIMPLREPRFKSIVDLMKARIDPSFRALAMAGMELAHSFLQLHAKGLCYRDISFGNVFFDPVNGDVQICDNDNVGVDKQSTGGVLGTPRFMAPEIVRGEAVPSTQTDLFSLAVLLFYMFMVHHPLEGEQEASIKCFDLPAMTKLYGTDPVFIFDPADASNRPRPGFHDNAIAYWPIYPEFLRDLFTKAFTDGIRDPLHGRVRESEWRGALVRLHDSLLYCGGCGSENFYDVDALKTNGQLNPCWSCQKPIQPPPRMRLGNQIIMLNHDTRLYPHHLDPAHPFDFSTPLAEVNRHPKNPNVWGLKNLSNEKWAITAVDGAIKDVEPGRNATLGQGVKLNFGAVSGEVRL